MVGYVTAQQMKSNSVTCTSCYLRIDHSPITGQLENRVTCGSLGAQVAECDTGM